MNLNKEKYSDAERSVREDLAAAYQLAHLNGWDDHIFTHFSARIPGPENHFLINSFGTTFDEVTAENLVKIDVDGNILDDFLGNGYNQAGYVIHGAIHQARPDVHCVLHTHTVCGVAVAAQKYGLLMLSQHAARFFNEIAYHDFEGFAFDKAEQARLNSDLGGKNILILRNHGLLTAGQSVAEAFHHLYFLEKSCEIQISAQSGATPLIEPDESVLQKTAEVYKKASGGEYSQRFWNAALRRLKIKKS